MTTLKTFARYCSALLIASLFFFLTIGITHAETSGDKQFKPYERVGQLQIEVETNGTPAIQALLTEVQTECEALKTRATQWQKPCDPRANLPITYEYLTLPLGDIYPMSPSEHQAQCQAATTKRCYWKPQEYNKYDGYRPTGDIWPEDKRPTDDIVRNTHYTRAWSLKCPNSSEIF